MAITDTLLEYYRDGKIRLDFHLKSVDDKQLLSNYLTSMDELINTQKMKIMDYPNNKALRHGLDHMSYVREKVWVRYNQVSR